MRKKNDLESNEKGGMMMNLENSKSIIVILLFTEEHGQINIQGGRNSV